MKIAPFLKKATYCMSLSFVWALAPMSQLSRDDVIPYVPHWITTYRITAHMNADRKIDNVTVAEVSHTDPIIPH